MSNAQLTPGPPPPPYNLAWSLRGPSNVKRGSRRPSAAETAVKASRYSHGQRTAHIYKIWTEKEKQKKEMSPFLRFGFVKLKHHSNTHRFSPPPLRPLLTVLSPLLTRSKLNKAWESGRINMAAATTKAMAAAMDMSTPVAAMSTAK